MIKPEDLRTGNLVRVNHDCMFPKGTMCVVTDINPLKVFDDKKGVVTLYAINDEDDGPWGVWCNYVEGIPVTPEILNKNGFKEEVVGEYYTKPLDNEEYSLARFLAVERKSCNWAVFIKYFSLPDHVLLRHIQYVHELQNTLWGVLGFDAKLKL